MGWLENVLGGGSAAARRPTEGLSPAEVAEIAGNLINLGRAVVENPAASDLIEKTMKDLARAAFMNGGRPVIDRIVAVVVTRSECGPYIRNLLSGVNQGLW